MANATFEQVSTKVCWSIRLTPFEDAYVERVLGAAVTRVPALEGSMRLLPGFRLLEGSELVLGEPVPSWAALRSNALSLANSCSIGFRSGEYGGR